MKLNPWVIGAVAVLGIGGAAFALFSRKPKPAASDIGFDNSKPAVPVTAATNYNPIDVSRVELDLDHLVDGPAWRYHGTVVV